MTELPIVVNMTVDASRTEYDLTAESNLEEIELLNDTVIETGGSHVPVYEGPYTVDAGLNAVTLDTDGKRMTQDVTVNALEAMTLNAPTISVNSSNGQITASVNYTPGYNDMYVVAPTMVPLSTQARATITPTTSEQTAVARGKYTTGAVKVRAISSPYADVSGVTATAGDVLSGKYFVDSSGVLTLGTATAGGGDGAPMPVDTVAEMIDTTKVYLYVGSETGYTFGDWYYYNGTAWVSGGKWGADGGVNTNARNLLDYILERVAYTETGMQVYVDALYEALAQAGAVTTTYTITNALSHVTNSNTATGCEEGDSYTGTLTADTDYTIDTVTVIMGGVDITSTAYNNGVITIASVTGDVVITAVASSIPHYNGLYTPTSIMQGSYITDTGEIDTATNNSGYYEDFIPISTLPELYVVYRSTTSTGFTNMNYRISIYNSNQTFLRQLHSQGEGSGRTGSADTLTKVTFENGDAYIRLGWYTPQSTDTSTLSFYLYEQATPLVMQIGNIDTSGADDDSSQSRLRSASYIPFTVPVVTRCPFTSNWASTAGYVLRFYDASYNYVGTTAFLNADNLSISVPSGTTYARLLIQESQSAYTQGWSSRVINPMQIGTIPYWLTEE